MASGNKLQLKFQTMHGVKTWTFSHMDENATTQQVKDLINSMIANGSIYQYPPLTVESAKLIQVQESDYILN